MTLARIALVLALAAVAAIAANVALLAVASGGHEPIGKLSPRALLSARPQPPAAPPASPSPPRGQPGHDSGESDD